MKSNQVSGTARGSKPSKKSQSTAGSGTGARAGTAPLPDGKGGRGQTFPLPSAKRFYISTREGDQVDLLNPDPRSFSIWEISHALSKVCRHSGQCEDFYSVAEHSVNVLGLVRAAYPGNFGLQLRALLHDASEAYLGDVPSPVKKLCPDYKIIEARIQSAIHARFGVPYDAAADELVSAFDHSMFNIEFPQVFIWQRPEDPTDLKPPLLKFYGPKQARQLFMARFTGLATLLK